MGTKGGRIVVGVRSIRLLCLYNMRMQVRRRLWTKPHQSLSLCPPGTIRGHPEEWVWFGSEPSSYWHSHIVLFLQSCFCPWWRLRRQLFCIGPLCLPLHRTLLSSTLRSMVAYTMLKHGAVLVHFAGWCSGDTWGSQTPHNACQSLGKSLTMG